MYLTEHATLSSVYKYWMLQNLTTKPEAESWTYNLVEVSEHNLETESSQGLRFPSTMFTLQTSFKPLLLKGRGGKIC